jgi:hypothetical protein
MREMDSRAALVALNEQLSDPGPTVLYRAAKNKGLNVSQK